MMQPFVRGYSHGFTGWTGLTFTPFVAVAGSSQLRFALCGLGAWGLVRIIFFCFGGGIFCSVCLSEIGTYFVLKLGYGSCFVRVLKLLIEIGTSQGRRYVAY